MEDQSSPLSWAFYYQEEVIYYSLKPCFLSWVSFFLILSLILIYIVVIIVPIVGNS